MTKAMREIEKIIREAHKTLLKMKAEDDLADLKKAAEIYRLMKEGRVTFNITGLVTPTNELVRER